MTDDALRRAEARAKANASANPLTLEPRPAAPPLAAPGDMTFRDALRQPPVGPYTAEQRKAFGEALSKLQNRSPPPPPTLRERFATAGAAARRGDLVQAFLTLAYMAWMRLAIGVVLISLVIVTGQRLTRRRRA